MKLRQVTLTKEFKRGLPNFSNITAGCSMTFDIGENEDMDFDKGWDLINKEVSFQSDLDQTWMKTRELKNHYQTTIKTKK